MRTLHTIAVYCSSSNQVSDLYKEAAFRLGQLFAEQRLHTVYGDGGIGLMGCLADGVLSGGGEITGVIPRFMVDEGWNNPKSSHTIVVENMHERKATIAKMADGMVALPGGIGTLEELSECLTWKQLGLHTKPIVILNSEGFYDPFLRLIDHYVDEKMMRAVHRDQMFTVVQTPEQVLPALVNAPAWSRDIRREAAI